MVKYLSVTQAKEFLANNKSCLIDVREPHEWQQGYLKNALLISKNDLIASAEVQFPEVMQNLILYCAVGLRAKWAAQQLLQLGYNHLYILYPGYDACKQAGFPITKIKVHEK